MDWPSDAKRKRFLCYQVVQGSAVKQTIKLRDQFVTQEVAPPHTLAYLGVPVDENGEGMWNEDVHLALYDILPFQLDPPKTIYIRDQFQKERKLTATQSVFLGVPSKKTVL